MGELGLPGGDEAGSPLRMVGGGGERVVDGVCPAALLARHPLDSGLLALLRHHVVDEGGDEGLDAIDSGGRCLWRDVSGGRGR